MQRAGREAEQNAARCDSSILQQTWPWLAAVVFAYNTSRQESIETSPYELVFGHMPRFPLELELGFPLKEPRTQSEYSQSVRKIFKEVREIVKVNLEEDRNKENKTRNKTKFGVPLPQERQFVCTQKGWKSRAKCVWPFEVVSILGVDYKIRSCKGTTMVVCHDLLKRSYAAATLFVWLENLGATRWFTLPPWTMLNLIVTMLHFSHGLGLGISGKMFTRLIVSVLLHGNTLRGTQP